MKPLIAVTTSELGCRVEIDGTFTSHLSPVRTAISESYLQAIELAGGQPVLLAPTSLNQVDAQTLQRFDGLVVAGGPDIDPAAYDAQPDPHLGFTVPRADSIEAALVKQAQQLKLPVLAICRGMQLVNVVRGGSLIQHLPDHDVNDVHRRGDRSQTHPVKIQDRSMLHGLLGDTAIVNSIHHQAIDRLGTGLTAVAWTDDSIVEAIEDPSLPFFIGVQWHPEVLSSRVKLFAALIEASRRSAAQ